MDLWKYRIDFPTAFYLDVINVGAPEELRQLNSRLWEWLGSDEFSGSADSPNRACREKPIQVSLSLQF